MSIVDSGMEALMDAFIYETNSLLEQLDEILLESEKANQISKENIDSIFRITHTIKGSAAMMGFNGISTLAHSLEDVFYILRENPEKLDMVFDALFDCVFRTSDFLKNEMEKVQDDPYIEEDASELTAQLKEQASIMNGEAKATSSAAKPAAAPVASADLSASAFRIRIFFEEECQMENMRAFMLLSQLAPYCTKLDSIPKSPESDSSCSKEIIENGLLILCEPTHSIEEVIGVVESALNIKSYEVLEPGEENNQKTASAEKSADSGNASSVSKSVNKQNLISVNQAKLDQLMDLVGEIVTAESMVSNSSDLRGLVLDNFSKSARELRKLTDELQDIVMSMRMVPLHTTFQKMNRIVRDMSKKLGKKVELVTVGGDTEVDKTINDELADPFMHMIRNSMDHALESPEERLALGKSETGKITLAARHAGGEIVIEVSDDGCGLDPKKLLAKAKANGLLTKPESEYTDKEAFHLIMLPGFSTNTQVTEYSGRGVGMDVVRKNIEKLGGTLSIHSVKNKGTVFTIKLPLTLAIIDGMNLAVGDAVFTLPITSIQQSFRVTDEKKIVRNTNGTEMIMVRGKCFPILRLHDLFDIETEKKDILDGILIQIESNHTSACLFADELLGEYQVVVKPFPNFFNSYNLKDCGLSGCSILGDGSISLILDANSLLAKQ